MRRLRQYQEWQVTGRMVCPSLGIDKQLTRTVLGRNEAAAQADLKLHEAAIGAVLGRADLRFVWGPLVLGNKVWH